MSCNSCSGKKKVFVIYYSTYGHVLTLAREVVKGTKCHNFVSYIKY